MNYAPHQQRVIDEANDLKEKADLLVNPIFFVIFE